MRVFKDTRGKSWFDIIKDIPEQMDLTISYPGTVKAFHYHDFKTEWMIVIEGEYKFVLTNPGEKLYLSQGDMIEIKPGRWHGYQVLGNKKGIIMEVANKKHNLKSPDDRREPWDKYDSWEVEKK